ncbi:hypothetical protein ACS5PJ_21315 [Pseudarthrobacter sp. YS3]|uniref:hypothetical protein n=1 Tax=Pseudarthrobacter sp. YS3 TaxID=3453718 RepID=UPI003EE9240F
MGNFGSRRILAVVVIALIFAFVLASVLFLTLFFYRDPRVEANTLEFEAAKTFLQIAGVILFGAFVALATFLFQQEWTFRRENFSRETQNLRDERERQDAALRNILNDTLETYNGVKRIRRVLKAETGPVGRKSISKEVYRRHLLDLNNYQLTFEYLKRTAPTLNDRRLYSNPAVSRVVNVPLDLEREYKGVESYLNRIVKEFEENLHTVEERESVPLSSLASLNQFVTVTGDFTIGVSTRIDQIIAALQKALLVPLVLPKVGGQETSL